MRKFNSSLPFVTLLLALTTIPALAFHFPEPNVTAENMSILIVEFDIDGEPLSNGDEVGVFDPDDVCAGLGVIGDGEHGGGEEGVLGIAAWADDRDTDQDEGFTAGDLIQYRIWDARYEVEMIAVAESGDEGGDNFDSTWASNGFIVVALHARGIAIHRVREIEHDFGVLDMVVGEAADWQAEIENIGNTVLRINGIEGEGNWRLAEIAVDDNQIEPDSSTNLTATFPGDNYQLGDDYFCIVRLVTNAQKSLIEFHLTGRIGAPRYELNRDEIDFGVVSCESERYGTKGWEIDSILIHNPGDATLLVSNIHCTTQEFFLWEGEPTEFSLSPGDSAYIHVVFSPPSDEVYTSWLTFESNSTNEPTSPKIRLQGQGSIPISVDKESSSTPRLFSLSPVYPNPFNGVATIRFSLPASSDIHLAVYDLMGAELAVLAKGAFSAGEHSVVIESKDFPAGMYAARLMSGKSVAESRFVIVK